MAIDQMTVRRLAFIRYLQRTGLLQSLAPAPLSCASILMIHDAVELFLQLASEHHNVGSGQPGFMDYWDLLKPKLGKDLEQKESMRRLNKARVALKHHGTFPSQMDIEAFRISATAFFNNNTPVVFGVQLDEVSLVEFVNPDTARGHLKEAEAAIHTGDTLTALDRIAEAFEEMIDDFESRKRDRYHRSPFYFGPDLTFQSSLFLGLGAGLGEFVDHVKDSLESMQQAIKILALGLDYRRYSRFKNLTPHIMKALRGPYMLIRRHREEEKPTTDDARFCYDFVVDSALVLGQADYTFEKEDGQHPPAH